MTPSEQPPDWPAAATVSAGRAFRFALGSTSLLHNVLCGALLLFIPVIGMLILQGWLSEVVVRRYQRHPNPVPRIALGDVHAYIDAGLSPFLITFLIQMLTAVVAGCLLLVLYAAGFALLLTTDDVLAMIAVITIGSVPLTALMALGVILNNSARTRAELSNSLTAAFSLQGTLAYARATWKRVALSHVNYGLVAFLLILCGLLLCGIGMAFAWIVVELAGADLRRMIYEDSLARNGPPQLVRAPNTLIAETR